MIAISFNTFVDTQIRMRKIARLKASFDALKVMLEATENGSLSCGVITRTRKVRALSGGRVNVASNGALHDGIQVFLFDWMQVTARAIKNGCFGDGCGWDELLGSAIAQGKKAGLSWLEGHGDTPVGEWFKNSNGRAI